MAAPTQLQPSQNGADAEDSCPLQYIRVRDSVLPLQLQYPSKTAEVEVVESPRLSHIQRPGLCSVCQRRQDDLLVDLQFGVEVETVAEVVARSAEEVHARLHAPSRGGPQDAAVADEKFMDGSCGHTRLEVHPPVAEELAVCPVGDAYPGTFVTTGVHQHDKEHESEEGRREDAALLHSVGHCECL
ncbi:hypothetical protein SprV_0100345300 [Sparganum proliferum]